MGGRTWTPGEGDGRNLPGHVGASGEEPGHVPAGATGVAGARAVQPGARAAADRRTATLRLVERRRRDAQAFMLAHQNSGLGRVGQAFV